MLHFILEKARTVGAKDLKKRKSRAAEERLEDDKAVIRLIREHMKRNTIGYPFPYSSRMQQAFNRLEAQGKIRYKKGKLIGGYVIA